jgi:hypothetical protein
MMDFTIKTLSKLYQSLQNKDYQIVNVCNFLQKNINKKVCILRHDVDRWLKEALRLAELEKKYNISASYYFRYPHTFNTFIMKDIYDLGHEIGYHYETLSKTKGDYEKAIALFKKELKEFRKITAIKTICAHGSVLSSWDNRKIWEKYNFSDFGIIGEVYLSIDFNEILYLSDTGRSWNPHAGNVRDMVETKFRHNFSSTNELIAAITDNTLPDKIMLNIHPNRWSNNLFLWTVELIGQNIKNLLKRALIHK